MVSENNEYEATSGIERKERKPLERMVPLLSKRSIIILVIGFVIGAVLGLGYWFISPSFATSATEGETGGLAATLGQPTSGPYECRVNIQIVNPSSSYMSMRELQNQGEYYAAKVNSLPFLKFLSQELDKQAPEYSHTIDELDQIMRIRYASNALDSRNPTTSLESMTPTIEVKVTGTSVKEALFLAIFVPEAFKDYLIAEEINQQQLEYENTLKEIESIKTAIIEAQQELCDLGPQGAARDIQNNPSYVALSAIIEALELELDRQAADLSVLIASDRVDEYGSILEQKYQETLQKAKNISTTLSEVEQNLRTLEMQEAGNDNLINSTDYIILNAKIRALELEIDRLMTGDTETTGLADMIASGITTGLTYKDTLEKVETASVALSEARKELAILESQSGSDSLVENLEYQLTRARVDDLSLELSVLRDRLTVLTREILEEEGQPDIQAAFEMTSAALSEARKELAILESQSGNGNSAENLEYQFIQAKIRNLNDKLADLTMKLSFLLGGNVQSAEITDHLIAGNPSMPTPVLPERIMVRSALMMGAIVGIGGAWAILNFRWIAKGMPRPSTPRRDEDEEE